MAEADDIQAQVIDALLGDVNINDIVGTRVYPGPVPEEIAHVPTLRVVKVADSPYLGLGGPTGSTTATIQVDCLGDIKETVNLLAKRVKLLIQNSALAGSIGAATVNGAWKSIEFDDDDAPIDGSDRWRYRRVLRFDIDYCEDVI